MRKGGVRFRSVIVVACFFSFILTPATSFGSPQASFGLFSVKGREKELAEHIQIPIQDLRKLEESPFKIPDFLRHAVNFWTDIYTRYKSLQVVLHDKKHLQVVYRVVDFSDIYKKNISYRRKKRLRRKKIESNRREIHKALKSLARKKIDSNKLLGLEKEIYNLFRGIDEKNKFKKAIKRVRAQIGHRESFRHGLVNSSLFMRNMEQIFVSYGLPVELTRLPFVESFFNLKAFSKVGASGIWQFIRSTGRLFVTINNIIDERNDPYKATHAAAKLLRGNFEELGSWPLAITAYNHGRLGVKRAVHAIGSNNLGDIIANYKRRRFGFASRNFYAEFLAALNIYEDYSKYFKDVQFKEPFLFDTFKLPQFVSVRSLAKYCGYSPEVLHEYNPELKMSVIASHLYIPKGYELRVPLGEGKIFSEKYAAIPKRFKMNTQRAFTHHRVTRGQTLSQIARIYKVRVYDIASLNNLPSRNFIRVGQVLKLPRRVSVESRAAKSKARVIAKTKVTRRTMPKSSKRTKVVQKYAKKKKAVPARKKAKSSRLSRETVRVKAKDKLILLSMLSPANEKSSSTSSASLIIKKALGIPRIVPAYTHRALSTKTNSLYSMNTFIREDEPVISVIDYPTADGTIIVQPYETLGHYAEWTETTARQLRRLNGMPYGRPIKVGRKIKIDLEKVGREFFEGNRRQYHRDLQINYLKQHTVNRIEKHVLKRKQNIWTLCQRVYKIPLWLLKKYNIDKDLTKLTTGDFLRIPIVVKKN